MLYSLNQITGFTEAVSGRSVSFTYDANGNRLPRTEGDAVTTHAYDRENRLIEVTRPHPGDEHHVTATPGTASLQHPDHAVQISYFLNAGEHTYRYAYDYRTRRVLRDESDAGGSKTFVVFSAGLSVREVLGRSLDELPPQTRRRPPAPGRRARRRHALPLAPRRSSRTPHWRNSRPRSKTMKVDLLF